MIRINLANADVRLMPRMVPTALGLRLFHDMSVIFAGETRKSVELLGAGADHHHAYKLSRKTLVLVDAEQLDAFKLVVPAIWGKGVTVAPFSPDMQQLRLEVEAITGKAFNICLANYYNTGSSTIAFHSDTEERGSTSCIASVSLGAERVFQIRAIPASPEAAKEATILASLGLEHGSLLVMGRGCQENYQHSLPRDKDCHSPRLNLTFRLFDVERYSV